MTKEEYIGHYVEKRKAIFEGLEYGLEYLNKLSDLEEKAEKSYYRKHKK